MGRPRKTTAATSAGSITDLENTENIELMPQAEKKPRKTKKMNAVNNSFPQEESIRIMDNYHKGQDLMRPLKEEIKSRMGIEKVSPADIWKLDKETKDLLSEKISDYNEGQALVAKSKEELIESLSMFVYWVISNNFGTFTRYSKDLYQEGILGILKGMEIYDARRSKATTFFYVYIIHEMNEFINININKTSSHYSSKIMKVKRAINNFEKENREWTIKDLATETGISPETISQSIKIIERSNEVYYDNLVNIEGKISGEYASPEENYIKKETLDIIADGLMALSPEERTVIILKYGLGGEEAMSYKNIFLKTGIPVDQIKKYNNKAIRKLRNNRQMKRSFKNSIKEAKAVQEGTVGFLNLDLANDLLDALDEIED